jgi:drug/metabolite transporter (DMT)-like permease
MNPVMWGALVVLSLGVSGIMARIIGRAIGPLPAILGNFAVGLLALVLWFLITGNSILWRLDGAHWLLATAAPFTIASLLFYIAFSRGPVSVAAPLCAMYPVFVIIGMLFLGIHPSAIQWAGMALVMPGVWIVARSGRRAAAEQPTGVGGLPLTIAIALGAAFLAGAGIMAAREASAIYGPAQLLLTVRIFGVALLLIVLAGALLSGRTNTQVPLRWWPVLVAVGVLDVGAVLALLIATQGEGAAIGAVASSPYAVITVLLAWIILREPIPLRQWGGIVLVIVGVAVLAGAN